MERDGRLGVGVTLICVPMETLITCFIQIFTQFSNATKECSSASRQAFVACLLALMGQKLSVVTCFKNKVP